MYRTKQGWRACFTVVLSAVLVTFVSGCENEEEAPVPTESQVVGSWSNPGGDWITFKKGGTGLISVGTQLQLSELIEEGQADKECAFSWGVDTVPAGRGKWVSVTFSEGQCGSLGPAEFGLYSYEDSGELRLSSAVEFPEPGEIYSLSKERP